MKILYCNPCFWDYRLPFYKELNRLLGGNFYVTYSTRRFKGHEKLLPKIKEQLGENAVAYENELMYNRNLHRFNVFKEECNYIPLPLGLWSIISKCSPDVLITEGFFQWTPIVQLWGWLHKKPVFMGYERTPHTERNNSRFKTRLRKWQDKWIAGYLVNGSETREYLMSIGVEKEKIHIGGMSADSEGLRNGIASMTESEKVTFRNNFSNSGDGLIYLFTGKLIERKGILPLLSAWKKHSFVHSNDRLIIVGDGEQMTECKEICKNESSVFLEGRVEYAQIHKYYAVADVYVMPTIEDNWSLVVPEAMACGLPVATSIYNGCHTELVREGENGIVFDTFKEESLVHALDYFHHVDLKSFGQRSIEIERSFNTEACAKREYDGIMKGLKR